MLVIPILKNIFKIKAVWLLLIFSIYPLLIFIAELTKSNFITFEATNGHKIAYIELLLAIHDTQLQFMLPIIIIGFVFSLQYFDEINTGRLILFKDLNRKKIFDSKLISLMLIYVIYISNLMISSYIVFKFYAVRKGLGTNTLLYTDTLYNKQLILQLLSSLGTEVLLIFIALLLSTKFNTGITIIGVIVSAMLFRASTLLGKIQYLLPSGHYSISNQNEFNFSILIIICLIFGYATIIYLISLKIFKQTQF
ncbi:hypothetical protein [Mammaliicoccus sp. Dog046]|uniref:hypothetical protein n=1 Tax=Mammaliicoccus sp. Dog046 TaxID=3034233 RepID=UPI002B25FF08|nr:hypothetical protein [Mammaliicoccus sp. Dog046]WQK84384.1 hypothetical protein P3U32_07000 [Mammaliicoccus sp. Dog046]